VLAPAVLADEPSLHERIDALVESTAPGLVAPGASDADFLRRAYLDFTGTIPDAATARAFLDDADAGKRAALVDRLLASPRFARHMQHTFDVAWMERRPDKGIADAQWQEYLYKSFADNKPLDQLTREILGADGADPQLRAAAKFYLDRDGEANLLARDVGRLFFGRDLQCAQCHDHPLVDDYLQSEYYGLLAFVNRGTVFNDEKEKKVYYAELAEGEVNFKSVFTGNARDRVLPELPQGAPLNEPVLAKAEQYVVAPAKDVRPVPKYSRRARLAALATCGTSAAFNRNLANRLWAQLMGRGIVHPLDMQHSGNPPVQSELLSLLADELVKMKFDARAFLRELTLTRTYQRSSEVPDAAGMKLDAGAMSSTLDTWQAEAKQLADGLVPLEEAGKKADAAADEAYARLSKAVAARDAAQKARDEAKKASDEIAAALATSIKDAATHEDALKTLVAARVAADAAAAKLPGDKPLAEAAAMYQKRANEVDTTRAAAQNSVLEKTPQVQAASLKLADADKTLQTTVTETSQAMAAVETADAAARDNVEKLRAAKAKNGELTARITDAQRALDFQNLTASGNPAAQQVAQTALVDRSIARFTLAPLKPLSPEQLAWSTMQATGQVEAQRSALVAQAAKDAEAVKDIGPEGRGPLEARLLEKLVDEKLRGNIQQFVSLFGQQPGQAPSFQATVHQALFLSNGGLLAGWLNPGGGNLTERLAKIEDAKALADELYLTVLTRRPTLEEESQVASYWEAAKTDKAAAAREMVWSLVTSAEFRFNR
jgi:hypothetical protein